MRYLVCVLAMLAAGCSDTPPQADWQPLFNGQDLSGWTPNFAGEPVGENYRDVFRMDDGVLRVDYSGWDNFDGKFGHLFTDQTYSSYDLRFQYRTVGDQVPGAPDWALRNNGVMLHAQDPKEMALEQGFPRCLELQLLTHGGQPTRTTGNICTPGTFVVLNGQLDKAHCISSPKPELPTNQWIDVRAEVRPDRIRFYVDDALTFDIDQVVVQTDDPMVPANALPDAQPITSGRIAFQAESHPTEFRKVQIRTYD